LIRELIFTSLSAHTNMQTTSKILLVKPTTFGFNEETAVSNTFQNQVISDAKIIRDKALKEFDAFVKKLRSEGIGVLVFEDQEKTEKPDAVFPNNWISMHEDGTMVLYPMHAPNRRNERSAELIEKIKQEFEVKRIVDLTHYEKLEKFLEGTGSIVFDHDAKKAFACISPRTDAELLNLLCKEIGYKPITFIATDKNNVPIYHTNVMMCIAPDFAVICLESIKKPDEKKRIELSLSAGGKKIIDITLQQMHAFAGNMLAIHNREGKKFIAMSESAFDCLTSSQKTILENFCTLLPLNVKTIETVEGGSVRCMMAEIFFERK